MGTGPRFGGLVRPDGIRFAVWSSDAARLWVSLFDGAGESDRLELKLEGEGVHALLVPGLAAGTKYGFRADGEYAPERGLWFDPQKLLVDPYAVRLDRPYAYDNRLAARRGEGGDTAPLMPKAVATALPEAVAPRPPLFSAGGLIYEVPVRGFSMLHPDVPPSMRGTLRALAHPAIIEHLEKLGVSTVELMPVTAWIDERHLPPLGLRNAWGYNPVTFMALDPKLAPDGIADLRAAVEALHEAGIGVILDLVFNHTGESDELGPTLSLRGLDNRVYYRHGPDGKPANDTGTGNTLACDHPVVRELVLDSLRHFVRHAGVDGFRFDLAPVLGRVDGVFDPRAGLFRAMRADAVLADRVLIAEPWDLGPDGYRLGGFPPPFLEWNDRYRDTVREYWLDTDGTAPDFSARLLGSGDIYDLRGRRPWSTINFIAAHDGFTVNDLVSYNEKHNEANGEDNNDGHDHNRSFNYGAEGPTDDDGINAVRERQKRNFLATLLLSHGTPMLLAGDEFGRSQLGNNNGYCQDSEISWLHWENLPPSADALRDFTRRLTAIRAEQPLFRRESWRNTMSITWLNCNGGEQTQEHWNDPGGTTIGVQFHLHDEVEGEGIWREAMLLFNPHDGMVPFTLPAPQEGEWQLELTTADPDRSGDRFTGGAAFELENRSLALFRKA